MMTDGQWAKRKVLITVRTYPVPSRKSVEVSCTAGITDDNKWIRLFPIQYRFLDYDKRFRKYQCIEASVTKSLSDTRPESYKIDPDTIQVLSESIPTNNNWELRKAKIFPLKSNSLCFLRAERDANKEPTLGFFKPKTISSLRIEKTNSDWTSQELAQLQQYSLFSRMPIVQLEKLPYIFSYEFKCNETDCKGHTLSCTDWEMGASYRKWRDKYGNGWETKFRDKYEIEMALVKDTHFFVGTLRTHPSEWIIIGLFYPPK
jgi:hypothetical protein